MGCRMAKFSPDGQPTIARRGRIVTCFLAVLLLFAEEKSSNAKSSECVRDDFEVRPR